MTSQQLLDTIKEYLLEASGDDLSWYQLDELDGKEINLIVNKAVYGKENIKHATEEAQDNRPAN